MRPLLAIRNLHARPDSRALACAVARVGWAVLSMFFEPPVLEPVRYLVARLAPHRPCTWQ